MLKISSIEKANWLKSKIGKVILNPIPGFLRQVSNIIDCLLGISATAIIN
jgi:hypothetical protein